MNGDRPDDLECRILQLLDGELDGDAIKQLDAELQGDPAARALFLQMAVLHSTLQDHYLSREEFPQMPIISIERLLLRQRRRTVRLSLLAAAAMIIISVMILWMNMAAGPPATLASFRTTPGTSFTLTHSDEHGTPAGRTLQAGSRLRIDTGTIELVFDAGTHCVIEAPCNLQILSTSHIRIEKGVAWFHVPPAAVGFKIETPQLAIVDLGTEFGVLAPADGSHEVHVFKGKIEVSTLVRHGITDKRILSAGHALKSDAKGRLLETVPDSSRFMTTLPDTITIRNPGFDLSGNHTDDHDTVGYGPIAQWATSGAGVGISSPDQPFLNQAAHSGTHSAFIQSSGIIAQSVSGFDPAKLYTVTYFVSERGLPGAATRTAVSLDLGTHSYSPPGNIIKTDAFRRIVSGPLAVFGPTANIEIRAATVSGDAALLVDSVSVSRAVPTVPDGGFENAVQGSKHFKQATGTGTGDLSGSAWSFAGGGGITTNGSDFMPPPAPEGSQAAVLQNANAEFRTTVYGFEKGVTYSLSLEAAGRSGGAAPFRVMLDDKPLKFGKAETLTPATGPYSTFSSDGITTGKESLVLSVVAAGQGTTFIDDLRFNFVAEADALLGADHK